MEKELRLRHCSDKQIKKEYQLSGPVTRGVAAFCRAFWEIRVIEGTKKPFFTFLIRDCLTIRGLPG